MDITELIYLTENKIDYYKRLAVLSEQEGNIQEYIKYKELLDITEITLSKLKTI